MPALQRNHSRQKFAGHSEEDEAMTNPSNMLAHELGGRFIRYTLIIILLSAGIGAGIAYLVWG